jgi:hypothetical protein
LQRCSFDAVPEQLFFMTQAFDFSAVKCRRLLTLTLQLFALLRLCRVSLFELGIKCFSQLTSCFSQIEYFNSQPLFFLNAMMGLFFSVQTRQLISRELSFVFVSSACCLLFYSLAGFFLLVASRSYLAAEPRFLFRFQSNVLLCFVARSYSHH